MESYFVKCKTYTKNVNQKVSGTSMVQQWYYQNVQYAVIKNGDLLKIKKQKDY